MTYFENLRECLDNARVLIAIHLYNVDECYFCLSTIAEGLEDVGEALAHARWSECDSQAKQMSLTVISRKARASF